MGKIGLAISNSNPKRVYAIIETGTGEPWKDKPTASGYCGGPTTAAKTGGR